MSSDARNTLQGARYFVTNAVEANTSDLTVFGYNIEAAIVFGRSVTFHLQKEFSDRPGFPAWYAGWQTKLKADPICWYFLTKRNYVLKEGPAQLARSISIFIDAGLTMHGEVGHITTFVGPWYRRLCRLSLEFLRRIRRSFTKRRPKVNTKTQRAVNRAAPARAEIQIEFQDSPVPHRPATDLLQFYLEKLDEVVADAELLWPAS